MALGDDCNRTAATTTAALEAAIERQAEVVDPAEAIRGPETYD
jgi:hypothetical protein